MQKKETGKTAPPPGEGEKQKESIGQRQTADALFIQMGSTCQSGRPVIQRGITWITGTS